MLDISGFVQESGGVSSQTSVSKPYQLPVLNIKIINYWFQFQINENVFFFVFVTLFD